MSSERGGCLDTIFNLIAAIFGGWLLSSLDAPAWVSAGFSGLLFVLLMISDSVRRR